MRRIRLVVVLAAMVCTVLAGSTSAVDAESGSAVSAGGTAQTVVPLGKRWWG